MFATAAEKATHRQSQIDFGRRLADLIKQFFRVRHGEENFSRDVGQEAHDVLLFVLSINFGFR